MTPERSEVLTEDDVQRMFPVLGKDKGFLHRILKTLKITDINEVHARHLQQRGADFARAALSDPAIKVSYKLHGEEHLQAMCQQGAFATVSNHPFGSLDGIMLIDIIGSVRPDYGVMVNGFLSMIACLRDSFIPVVPPRGISGDSKEQGSMNGVKEVLRRFSKGQPVGFFPAGGISVYQSVKNRIMDAPWQPSVAKILLRSQVPVYPIYFSGRNSWVFHFLGWLSWAIRTPRIPAELFNKRGHSFDVYIGQAIGVDELKRFEGKPEELALYLYDRTYSLCPKRKNRKK